MKVDANSGEHFSRAIVSAKEKGEISEEKTNKALERLKRRGQIIDSMQVSGIEKLDSKKVDFITVTIKGAHHTLIPLQVKSSWVGLNEHEKAIRQARGKQVFKKIPAIIVNERDSIEDLCGKILNVIS